jgi:hypothetical protein
MGIFTSAEIDTQIAAYKAALLACASGQSYRLSNGIVDRSFTQNDLPEIRNTLTFLAQEKAALQGKSIPCIVSGRPAR